LRPYLERLSLPVGAGGGGGGAFSHQQAETPSVAAVKAAKTKYLTKFIVLKPDFQLSSKQPALVGVAVVRRIRQIAAARVATFTSWSDGPFQRTAPDRVSGENPNFRSGKITTLGLQRRGDGKNTKFSRIAERVRAGIAAHVVDVVETCLSLDREVVGDPDNRP